MSFADAVRTCLTKYAVFDGRARRSEFWWFFLFTTLVSVVTGIIDSVIGTDYGNGVNGGALNTITSLALLLPSIAVGSRRLHDTGRSGWWQLLWFAICIGWIFLIIWLVQDSRSDNKYGPSPKRASPAGPYGAPPPPNPYGA
jgi:uncharacterized membrane protein YhaH (DUF805 family)